MAHTSNFLAVMACAIAFPASGAETFVQRQDLSTLCHNADTVVAIWQSQNTILSLDYQRKPAALVVDGRRWLQLGAKIQENIALSAYCRLQATDATADMEVRNQGENLFGIVRRGQWINRLTGG